MKFNVSRLIIWFEPVDEPQVLSFYPNKVNVITGNSSTGKSNIIAIINYCLLSEKSNIVEPVINQFSNGMVWNLMQMGKLMLLHENVLIWKL